MGTGWLWYETVPHSGIVWEARGADYRRLPVNLRVDYVPKPGIAPSRLLPTRWSAVICPKQTQPPHFRPIRESPACSNVGMSTTPPASTLLGLLFAPLEPWLADPEVEEIMVNRPDEIWVESRGRYESPGIVLAPLAIRSAITALGRLAGRDVGTGFPAPAYLDTRFRDLRITAVCHPVSVRSDVLSIRKPQARSPSLESLCAPIGRLAPPRPGGPEVDPPRLPSGWAGWFQSAVRARKNFLVTGGTSSGKTTFLNGLLTAFAPDERVISIEETPELRVSTANWVALEARDAPGLEARSLVRLALRLRPDRLLIGEVRGAEAFDLLQACNTGHRGTLTSVHANSARDGLVRLETLVLTADLDWPHAAIQNQVASAFDYVVHMERLSGIRKPAEIMAVHPAHGGGYCLEPVRIPEPGRAGD